ncbi:hypothetical protein R1sor_000856 [Riccia sorocarpa]|uniref:Uncharacterized protein n=1 Tax=Riccia sorocarpa TaxID=122646 RepID=A0ABD3H0D2_9MARC
MATRNRKDSKVKVKEVKLLPLTKEIRTKLNVWGLGGLFSVGWSDSHEALGKIQFPELKLLKLVKGEKRPSKSGVLIDQVDGTRDFIEFCRLFNLVFAPGRPEHYQHNQFLFYHYAWLAILDPSSPTPNWGDAIAKTVSRQVKSLGKCNEPTCLGPYLAHLYTHFKEMGSDTTKTSNPDTPNKRKAQRQVISNSETETEEQKEVKKEKASSSQLGEKTGPSDQPVDINELGIQLFDLRKVTSKIFRVLHLDPILGSAADLVEALKSAVSAATPALTVDLKPWKEMIAKLVKLLSLERQKRKGLAKQHVYLEEKITRAGKVPKMAIWCAHQLQAARETETRLGGDIKEGVDFTKDCQNPPTGGSEPDSDDNHVTHIVHLAKMMIVEE